MEHYVPHSYAGIRAGARELAFLSVFLQPQHSVDPSQAGILDCDLLHRLLHAPNVHVGIERSGGTVSAVGGPLDRVDSCGVESPSRGNQLPKPKQSQSTPFQFCGVSRLFLLHVKEEEFPARLGWVSLS